jgi:hypothetical protein
MTTSRGGHPGDESFLREQELPVWKLPLLSSIFPTQILLQLVAYNSFKKTWVVHSLAQNFRNTSCRGIC